MRYIGFFLLLLLSWTHLAAARSIFVNGEDASSATDARLDRVQVYIDKKGDVYITAPNYELRKEDTFLPLSQPAHPEHQTSVKDPSDALKPVVSAEELPKSLDPPSLPGTPPVAEAKAPPATNPELTKPEAPPPASP